LHLVGILFPHIKVHSGICDETLITDKQMTERNNQEFWMYHSEILGYLKWRWHGFHCCEFGYRQWYCDRKTGNDSHGRDFRVGALLCGI